MKNKGKLTWAAAVSAVLLLLLASCVPAQQDTGSEDPIIFGTSECCEILDPANTYSNANWPYLQQIYPSLINSVPETTELQLDLAESAEFINPTTFRVVMKSGLNFSNGNSLSASDAVFSLNRQINIQSPNGPGILVQNIESVTLVDDSTLDITLRIPNDVTILKVLSSMVGLIVDEEIFAAERVMENFEIVEGNSYGGPYVIQAFEEGTLLSLVPNPEYRGVWGAPRNKGVIIRSYQESTNMVSDYENGKLDAYLLYRETLTNQALSGAEKEGSKIYPGPTTESVMLYLSQDNLPFGAATDNPDASKAQSVRKAISLLVDRDQINELAYFNTYYPMFSAIPSDIEHSINASLNSAAIPNLAEARANLSALGLELPVQLRMITSSGRYGDLGLRLASVLETQLETGGLFDVTVDDLEWQEVRERRKGGAFETMIQMWGADFADPDNYVSPLAKTDGWIKTGYSNSRVDELLDSQAATADFEARGKLLAEVQQILSEELPFIPLVSGGPALIVSGDISGAEAFVNREFKYLFPYLSR